MRITAWAVKNLFELESCSFRKVDVAQLCDLHQNKYKKKNIQKFWQLIREKFKQNTEINVSDVRQKVKRWLE